MINEAFFFDLGNIIFFIATFPQLKKTIQNRKQLKDLSPMAFLGYTLATVCFWINSIWMRAYFALALTSFNIVYNLITIYWILKARRK